MVTRIDIKYRIADARGEVKKRQFESLGFKGKIRSVELRDSYTIDASLSKDEIKKIAAALANPLVEQALVNRSQPPEKFNFVIEIGFLPGVTDNIGNTTKETIEDLIKRKFKSDESVYSSTIFFIDSKLTYGQIQIIAESLYNPLIQRAQSKSAKEYLKDHGMGTSVPKVKLNAKFSVDEVDLNISEDRLELLGKKGIENHDKTRRGPLALDLDYLLAIKKYFNKLNRKPTDIELESIAQTWSEHCKHTIFANPIDDLKDGLYKTYIKKATEIIRKKKGKKDFCVSVFSDNSGAIELNRDYLITHKVETHNSPSALDPFGGAVTGIVGVNRDTIGFGLGAKPIINTYGFCLADPKNKQPLFRDSKKTQKMLLPARIMRGVIQGVNVGGNCSGIPTAQGFLFFDNRFRGKPLVFVGTVGLMPKKLKGRKLYTKKAQNGDYVVMIGGRVGQDGIHGATFSSEAMDSGSPATAVQIGDPITQKKLSDAIVKEARDRNLYNSITDNGAGGLSCSVAEMAKESGGCEVYLDKVPLKYPGLEPWKIWISESQERMTLAVPKRKWPRLNKLMKSRGVEATVIGEFNNSGKCQVRIGGKIIMDIEMNFLHNGLPKKPLKTKKIKLVQNEPKVKKRDLNVQSQIMLGRLNLCGYDFISKQYDHEVQAGSVLKPVQGRGRVNSDVSVTRAHLGLKNGVILSYGLNPNYSDIDTYQMAACSIDSAIRAAVAAGANLEKLAILDNFCWCSSNEPERLYQLKQAAKACYDLATFYETPFISGKDSMFNDFRGFDGRGNQTTISIPPTLLISAIGVLDDFMKSVSMDLKIEGDLIYLLGETKNELGASEYYTMISEQEGMNYLGNNVPKVNAQKNRKMYLDFYKAAQGNLIASATSVARGGLVVALSKMAIAGNLGLDISLKKSSLSDEAILFSESQGRIIAEVAPQNKEKFEKIMKNNSITLLGRVATGKKIVVKIDEKKVVDLSLSTALNSYRKNFKDY